MLRLQLVSQEVMRSSENSREISQIKINIKKILPSFNPEIDDISLFLTLFEPQMKLFKASGDMWVTHLVGALPNGITKLVARIPRDEIQDCE
ncbi:hypothetical protein TNIN_213111 [Trichonephila inaurata madagascariensis]|uniref:Uncharacterized protein n=1 Tax=Trichonephila inaurata madagascariensis TaxID=2747483 RepID=A0A8X6XQ70_9ARAC|nr:hypothetical protein TNIN_213111 [Trichonephila inaurata madagascariensis]